MNYTTRQKYNILYLSQKRIDAMFPRLCPLTKYNPNNPNKYSKTERKTRQWLFTQLYKNNKFKKVLYEYNTQALQNLYGKIM
jgi:hypothetical protein